MRVQIILMALLVLITMISAKIPDPYKVLGVKRDSNEDQIKDGFKRRSKKYHPDRNKQDPRAKEKFQKIVNAYELLKDPQRKRMYDLTGDQDPNAQQQGGFGGGFGGGGFGGFPGGGFGINIEDLMRQGFFGGGHPGQGHGQGGQRRQQTYSFSFGM